VRYPGEKAIILKGWSKRSAAARQLSNSGATWTHALLTETSAFVRFPRFVACSITPTGAAIVREFAGSFGPMLRMKIERIGYGVGARELKEGPNVLRAGLGEAMGCCA
jgi:Protein of unknown function DUF111